MAEAMLSIEVVWIGVEPPVRLALRVPAGTTVGQALAASGIARSVAASGCVPDGQALLESLCEQFLAAGVKLVAELGVAAAGDDCEGARRAAHTLMGSAANFGAADLVAACELAEHAAAELRLPEMQSAAARVPQEFELVRMALLEACLRA
jgi:HPt (histidine-containing phosphotransfer) domain-containing protein